MFNNIFVEFFNKYTSKLITKEKFIDCAYKNHNILFDYANYLKFTDIKSISISDDEVKMISRKEEIVLLCKRNDKRIVPFEIINFKNYEGEYFNFYLNLIKKAKVVFDIGSNIGWYSLNAAKINKKIIIYAFEPIKDTYDYLIKNIKLNQLNNIIPNNIGLSDKNATVNFYVNPEISASASEAKITNFNTKRIKVTLKKLDDFCDDQKISIIDLIKCDVEGAELFVLKGGKKIIEKFKPIIFIEMLRKWEKKYNYHPNDIIDLMKSFNYLCFTIDTGKLKQIAKVTEVTKATNFIFFHKIRHDNCIKEYEAN